MWEPIDLIIRWLVVLLILAQVLGCKEGAVGPAGRALHEAQGLTAEEETIDLGEIMLGTTSAVPVSFNLKNAGTSRLSIVAIRPSCDCLKLELSSESVAAGETAQLRMHVRVGAVPRDSATAAVEVVTDDPVKPITRLRVKWHLVSLVVIEPPQLNLGEVSSGSVVETSAVVLVTMLSASALLHAQSEHDDVECSLSPMDDSEEIPDERRRTSQIKEAVVRRYVLNVRVRTGGEPDARISRIRLSASDDQDLSITVPVTWRARPRFEAMPRSLIVATVSVGETIERTLRVCSTSSESVRLIEVTTTGNGLTVVDPGPVSPDDLQSLTVRFKAPDTLGPFKGAIVMRFDQDDGPTIKVPFVTFIQKAIVDSVIP